MLVVKLDEIVSNKDLMKPFTNSHVEGQKQIRNFNPHQQMIKLTSSFDYLEGQIVNLICWTKLSQDNNMRVPAIITKVHSPDINGHNTYDFTIPVRGDCEFISFVNSTERYLWRFTDRENPIPDKWIIDLVKYWYEDRLKTGVDEDEFTKEFLEKICYYDNSKIGYVYPNR